MTGPAIGLGALVDWLARDLELLEVPAKSWVTEIRCGGARVRDVILVGAGMCGLAGAGRLKLARVELDDASVPLMTEAAK